MYAAVQEMALPGQFPATAVCDVLDISRSGYFAWRQGVPSVRAQRDEELTPLVRALFWKHRRRYGARRIASELADLGEVCSPRRVAKIMNTQRLRAIQPKSFVPKTTDSRHGLGYSPNLLQRSSPPLQLNRCGRRYHLPPSQRKWLRVSGFGARSVFTPRCRLEPG